MHTSGSGIFARCSRRRPCLAVGVSGSFLKDSSKGAHVWCCAAGFLQKELLPCLDEMQKDADPDVSSFAKSSLALIN